jgi:hypothetical protein
MIGGPMKSVEQIVENIYINDMCVESNSCVKKKMKVGRPKKYTSEGPDFAHLPFYPYFAFYVHQCFVLSQNLQHASLLFSFSVVFHSFFFLLFQCHPLSCFHEEKADNCENVFILSKKEHKVGKGKKYNYQNRNINNIAKDLKYYHHF